ncbi:hypothetical protein CHS0354_024816 [Potamilus streckersoni]|uniref:Uncharacterized protein n=1 Tax=Potamilus streckersoni TaxID=2493646 RepID=A0AAE0W5E3_9BIVA|nr:hypothetical protein CHS0354_024816 [Potamilus streckersoni]
MHFLADKEATKYWFDQLLATVHIKHLWELIIAGVKCNKDAFVEIMKIKRVLDAKSDKKMTDHGIWFIARDIKPDNHIKDHDIKLMTRAKPDNQMTDHGIKYMTREIKPDNCTTDHDIKSTTRELNPDIQMTRP